MPTLYDAAGACSPAPPIARERIGRPDQAERVPYGSDALPAANPADAARPGCRRDATRRPKASIAGCAAAVAALVVAASMPAFPARAQFATDPERAPTLTVKRYGEDWSTLADPARRTGRWTEPFKYIPLTSDGTVYLTTGMEARSRFEAYDAVAWGAAPDDAYVWHRFMPYADLHVGQARVFSQPIVSAISGGNLPRRPIDTTGIDLLQAFAEAELAIAELDTLRMSAGRKLVSYGAERLVATRYGPGVPQAFDGVEAVFMEDAFRLSAFHLRPVDTSPGDFDDRASPDRLLWGGYATLAPGGEVAAGLDLYYLGFRDRAAVFDQGVGREVVHTVGSRVFGDAGAWSWNLEAAFQSGTFAGGDVAAFGAGGEVSYRFGQAPLQPEIGFAADVVSGDDDPGDADLGTFNPMFPSGKYFGALTVLGPRNLVYARPSVAIRPHPDVVVSLTGSGFWRESTNDGIYTIGGGLLRGGDGSDARFVGTELELAVDWQATPELNLSASVSTFEPGRFVRDTGPAERIGMIGAAANFRF